jgi:hypothetical protein
VNDSARVSVVGQLPDAVQKKPGSSDSSVERVRTPNPGAAISATTVATARSRLAAVPVPVEQDGAVRQGGLTVITRILPGHTTALRALLNQMDTDPAAGTDVESNTVIPFMALTRVHFARWLIVDEATDVRGLTIPASLVFETNYDEPFDDHLAELVDAAGAGLDLIYEHCSGYPPPGQRSAGGAGPAARARCAALRAHARRRLLLHAGHRRRALPGGVAVSDRAAGPHARVHGRAVPQRAGPRLDHRVDEPDRAGTSWARCRAGSPSSP